MEDQATPMSFGAVLREHRLAARLTQDALAERAGLGTRGIQDLEHGLHQPHRQTVQRLVLALDLSGEARRQFERLAGAAPRQRQPVSPIRPFVPQIVGRTVAERSNLPLPPTALIGREREVATVVALLRDSSCRLVTLTGPGGIGKTRLAIQVATDCVPDFPDGTFFVPLASLTDPDLVVSTIARVLGLREIPNRSALEIVRDAIRVKRLLLVLDNFEPVVQAAPVVADLLAACPGSKVLVTSRTVLQLQGERVYDVGPLAVPDLRTPTTSEQLTQYASVQLFVDRAEGTGGNLARTEENTRAVAAICARVEGVPLAIELAAARTRLLSPRAILTRLSPLLPLLGGGARDLPARHQTMRDTIAWSYDLLDETEKLLFRRLAVFVGGFTVDAALAIGASMGLEEVEVLNRLESLIGQSLLRSEDVAGEPRLRMLEAIREYGAERLVESGDEQEMRRRHVAFYLNLAERAEFEVWKAAQVEWLNRLELEHDNIRVALRDTLETDPDAGLRLAGALWRFWCDRCHHREARSWLEAALAAAPEDALTRGRALHAFGMVAYSQGDFGAARSAFERSLPILRAGSESWRLAHALVHMGNSAQKEDDHIRARASLEEGLAIARSIGDHLLSTIGLAFLGELELAEGHAEQAEQLWIESLELCRQDGDLRCWDFVLWKLGALARARGDLPRARDLVDESLALAWKIGHGPGIRSALREQAALAQSRGNFHRSVRLLAASEQVFGRIHLTWITPPDALTLLLRAREQIGDESVDRTWAEGQAMTLEQAITYARSDDRDPRPA
jgi:predicted ATPase/transcriptional regulator with XRE-family HTH domain